MTDEQENNFDFPVYFNTMEDIIETKKDKLNKFQDVTSNGSVYEDKIQTINKIIFTDSLEDFELNNVNKENQLNKPLRIGEDNNYTYSTFVDGIQESSYKNSEYYANFREKLKEMINDTKQLNSFNENDIKKDQKIQKNDKHKGYFISDGLENKSFKKRTESMRYMDLNKNENKSTCDNNIIDKLDNIREHINEIKTKDEIIDIESYIDKTLMTDNIISKEVIIKLEEIKKLLEMYKSKPYTYNNTNNTSMIYSNNKNKIQTKDLIEITEKRKKMLASNSMLNIQPESNNVDKNISEINTPNQNIYYDYLKDKLRSKKTKEVKVNETSDYKEFIRKFRETENKIFSNDNSQKQKNQQDKQNQNSHLNKLSNGIKILSNNNLCRSSTSLNYFNAINNKEDCINQDDLEYFENAVKKTAPLKNVKTQKYSIFNVPQEREKLNFEEDIDIHKDLPSEEPSSRTTERNFNSNVQTKIQQQNQIHKVQIDLISDNQEKDKMRSTGGSSKFNKNNNQGMLWSEKNIETRLINQKYKANVKNQPSIEFLQIHKGNQPQGVNININIKDNKSLISEILRQEKITVNNVKEKEKERRQISLSPIYDPVLDQLDQIIDNHGSSNKIYKLSEKQVVSTNQTSNTINNDYVNYASRHPQDSTMNNNIQYNSNQIDLDNNFKFSLDFTTNTMTRNNGNYHLLSNSNTNTKNNIKEVVKQIEQIVDENFSEKEDNQIKEENHIYENISLNLSRSQSNVFSVHSTIHDNGINCIDDDVINVSFEESIKVKPIKDKDDKSKPPRLPVLKYDKVPTLNNNRQTALLKNQDSCNYYLNTNNSCNTENNEIKNIKCHNDTITDRSNKLMIYDIITPNSNKDEKIIESNINIILKPEPVNKSSVLSIVNCDPLTFANKEIKPSNEIFYRKHPIKFQHKKIAKSEKLTFDQQQEVKLSNYQYTGFSLTYECDRLPITENEINKKIEIHNTNEFEVIDESSFIKFKKNQEKLKSQLANSSKTQEKSRLNIQRLLSNINFVQKEVNDNLNEDFDFLGNDLDN